MIGRFSLMSIKYRFDSNLRFGNKYLSNYSFKKTLRLSDKINLFSYKHKRFCTSNVEGNPKINNSNLLSGSLIGCILLFGLYITRLRNPIYKSWLGQQELSLQLANNEANLPLNAKWDTRSANDSMKSRLKSMERYLGNSLSSSNSGDLKLQERVNDIRMKGYTNGGIIALKRALHWAQTGEVERFEKELEQVRNYIMKGGKISQDEIDDVIILGYNAKVNKLLALAQTKANSGDVSGTSKNLSDIRSLLKKIPNNKSNINETNLENTLKKAHKYHLNYMLDEARLIKQNGSTIQAKKMIEKARNYASNNKLDFDEEVAQKILS